MDTVGLRTNSFPDKCTPFSGDNFLNGLVRAAEKKVRDDLRVLEPGGGAHAGVLVCVPAEECGGDPKPRGGRQVTPLATQLAGEPDPLIFEPQM